MTYLHGMEFDPLKSTNGCAAVRIWYDDMITPPSLFIPFMEYL